MKKSEDTFDKDTLPFWAFPLHLLACIRHAKCSRAWWKMLTRTRDVGGERNEEKADMFKEKVLEKRLPALFIYLFFFVRRPNYSGKVISIMCPFYFPLQCLAIGQSITLNLEHNKLILEKGNLSTKCNSWPFPTENRGWCLIDASEWGNNGPLLFTAGSFLSICALCVEPPLSLEVSSPQPST